MERAEIATKVYKPHSLRSASSTKAVEMGQSISDIKDHANWSHQTKTFEKYYYKPTAQENKSTNIVNSIFSFTDNHTTLGDVAESTKIVVRSSNNQMLTKRSR
ncbi:hypothetical protein RO3G_16922 [Rhizopus delemar RA 99-880]|uniref:Tyr recombinase domain-containing protein n=1 Tax=Rhizopus delemar (strain RA 99-880 / ATCC MYA-4621 / FGSC 9543 / NRRL 43880) TaxID=246409 RepID=I1CVC0_RHIO9|nr:hypothetical protein RO3G_16922 [Rhizopus delemar RA 99-880]|eukprot:EIE92400.1 hypothetical protein RO3G_16922 [Rhizopus delemar RA 99-880]